MPKPIVSVSKITSPHYSNALIGMNNFQRWPSAWRESSLYIRSPNWFEIYSLREYDTPFVELPWTERIGNTLCSCYWWFLRGRGSTRGRLHLMSIRFNTSSVLCLQRGRNCLASFVLKISYFGKPIRRVAEWSFYLIVNSNNKKNNALWSFRSGKIHIPFYSTWVKKSRINPQTPS